MASALGIHRRSALILLLAASVMFGGGVVLLDVRHARAREAAQHELSAIADQRVSRLADWRQERLADGKYFSGARFAAEGVKRWLSNPESQTARVEVADWLGSLQGEHRYYEVMILDSRLERRLSLPPEARGLTAMERARLAEVLQSGEVVLTDLEIEEDGGRIYCDVLFPVFDPSNRQQPPVAIGLLRANARSSLFPILGRWPIPSDTAETLLVRQEGAEILFLNDLRHYADTALTLRRPMSNSKLSAARVLSGETAPFEGIDYRGVPVVAVGRLIPGTPWALVAKVDQREIYGAVRSQLLAESALLGSALLAGAMAIAFLWQKQRSGLLRSAAAEWERTFDSVPDLIAILDDRKRVVRVNRAMAERIGRSQADCAGVPCYECVHGMAAEPGDCPHLQTATDGQIHSTELFDPRLGGDFHITTAPLFDERGRMSGTVHVARDITARKKAEAELRDSREAALKLMADAEAARREAERAAVALRHSHERLEKVLEVQTVGVMFWDLTTGCLTDANDTFLEMMGYSRSDVEANDLTWQKLTPPEYHEVSLAEIEKFQATGRVGPYEKEYFRKDGTRQWLVFAGSSLGNNACVEFCVDISARKRAEEALRESEAKYRAVFEQAAIGIGRVSFADAQWIDVNETFCRMLGYSPEEMRATPWPRITHPEDVELDLVPFQKMAAGELNSYSVEKRFIHQEGHYVWARLTLSLVRDAKGRPDYEVAIIEDITERVRAEHSLKTSLREKEVLLKEIHHRVKNNMQVLSSLVSLQSSALVMSQRSAANEPFPATDDRSATSDQAVLAAFDDLRDRVRSMALVHEKLYQSQNLAAVDFATYLESLLQYLWEAHRVSSAIRLKLSLEPMSLTVDRAVPCGLIVNELASNALKHAFRGRSEGTVTVSCHVCDARIQLCVSDDGVGLPSGLDWRQAPSLGLQLVQMLSRQLGAIVEGRPSGQGGTEFEITFEAGR